MLNLSVLASVASTAWSFAGSKLLDMAGKGVEMLGSIIGEQNSKQELAALESKKNELEKEKAMYEKELETKRKDYSEEQRDLDAEKEMLLEEQENLIRAEAKLANKEVVPDHKGSAKHLEKVRKRLFQQLERYERDQNILRERQEETDREYAEHRKRLEDAYEALKQNQSEIIHLLKTLPAVQKAKELQALTDNFRHNCQIFVDDPDVMVDKTEKMQSKYSLKLMEVRNVMREGHFFPGSMKIWADATLLDLYMLGFLVTKGVLSHSTVEIAKDLYHGYWNQLKLAHSEHKPVTEGPDQLQVIDHLLVRQFKNFDRLLHQPMSSTDMPPALGPTEGDVFHSTSNSAYGAQFGDQFDCSPSRRHSLSVREGGAYRRPSAPEKVWRGDALPSRDEDRVLILEKELAALRMEMGRLYDCPRSDNWDRSEQRKPSPPLTRSSTVVPSTSGLPRHRLKKFESDPRREQRYSQDPQECGAGCNQSRNKREPQQNRREPLAIKEYQHDIQGSRNSSRDQQQHHEGQHISYGKQGHRRVHDHDGSDIERQNTGGRRNALAEPPPSRSKYQDSRHSPDNRPESSEESGSSSEEQTWDWSEQRKPSRSTSRNAAVISSASSAGGSAHHLGKSFESDPRGKQRYPLDSQECAVGRKHSGNKRKSQRNCQEPLAIDYLQKFQGGRYPSQDQQQYRGGQYIPGAEHGNRKSHNHEGDQERLKIRGRRNDRAGQKPSRQKNQERPRSPDDRSESSSSDGHVGQHEQW